MLDENTGYTLMFDDKEFKRSKLYFTLLQLYRIFERCIEETLVDLEASQKDFLESWGSDSYTDTEDVLETLASDLETLDKHWREAMSESKKQLESIMERIKYKREEVNSLRDGVSQNCCFDNGPIPMMILE